MTASTTQPLSLPEIRELWKEAWPKALTVWTRFAKLREPLWCESPGESAKAGLRDSFAMIRLLDHTVVVDLTAIQTNHLEHLGFEILAHEVGHHIYCPADLTDHGRMLARIRRALPQREHLAAMVANLYSDLLINNRLQRQEGLRIAEVYKRLGNESTDKLWNVYLRIYEILWSLPRKTLTAIATEGDLERDAQLGARLVRVFARDWLPGAGRFAAICYPYLMENQGQEVGKALKGFFDALSPAPGGELSDVPEGLIECDPDEASGAIHPAFDDELSGLADAALDGTGEDQAKPTGKSPERPDANSPGTGQFREPYELGEILRGMGISFKPEDLAWKYYRDLAAPHRVRFPVRKCPESIEPLPEGLDTWDVGTPLEELDVIESAMISPRIIPGVTTVLRQYGTAPGSLPETEPVDLDLYVDSSGSMPNPRARLSYLTLAGAIIVLSALRARSRVQATLWSGKQQFMKTPGFIQNEQELFRILTGFIGGWTAFPIHILRDTFQSRTEADRPVHILIISDLGVDTMFQQDEQGESGWNVSAMALKNARGGGTMVLNMPGKIDLFPVLKRAAGQGWNIHPVDSWEKLVVFAREFSKLHYGRKHEK